ncbi:MAG: allophanate hydrolase [Betaproteobacteria bacterium]|nr:allophanate hydrolase [Betaproteobacteria bacterium]
MLSLDLQTLASRYRAGSLTPRTLLADIAARIAARGDDKVWIHRIPAAELEARAAELERIDPASLPLYGIPFAIKDIIDVAGHPTTAGCPDYAYRPAESATAVARLLAAGAILVGKTNLDQFATGLVGTRSPYGACPNSIDPSYISGGSSSGSAVCVAAGLVSFSFGTDTAGSGRVPAAFNNIVGLKPTKGLLSTRGVVPACRSLDCISIFALSTDDAQAVLAVAGAFDAGDPYSRDAAATRRPRAMPDSLAGCRVGVPRGDQLAFFGNRETPALFDLAVARVAKLGGLCIEIDFAPFLDAARLLYEGPWVSERYLALREFLERQPDSLLPVTRQIIGGGATPSAADCFAAQYRLQALIRQAEPVWRDVDIILTPTAGTLYTIAAVNADPIRLNINLGYYTNFMNLMDLAAIAVPAGFQEDGMPFGVTLVAPAFQDDTLCRLGGQIHRALVTRAGATGLPLPPARPAPPVAGAGTRNIRVAVCGAQMSGLPLNHQLSERGARLLRTARTAPCYRFYALTGFKPPRPGLVRVAATDTAGCAIDVEVWEVPAETFGGFVDGIPGPLGIGTVALEDGEELRGFICEAYAVAGAEDISRLGSWRAFVARGAGR